MAISIFSTLIPPLGGAPPLRKDIGDVWGGVGGRELLRRIRHECAREGGEVTLSGVAEKKFWTLTLPDALTPQNMDRKRETTTLAVHRCRFVDYAPSSITALAYPPLPLPSLKGKKKTTAGKQPLKFGLLAVGHANGNIDICEWMGADRESQCSQAWVVRKVCAPYLAFEPQI